MPWGKLINKIETYLITEMPKGCRVVDLMCGPGYLLGRLDQRRSDVVYMGVDLDNGFIDHAKGLYPRICFECADVVAWSTQKKFDVVICTGGVHHLPDNLQSTFIYKISCLLNTRGVAIIADPYIDDYDSQEGRILAGARLGYEYLVATIKNGAPPDVIEAAIQVLRNDVLTLEWKTSFKKQRKVFEQYFKDVFMYKTWPAKKKGYGDCCFIVKK